MDNPLADTIGTAAGPRHPDSHGHGTYSYTPAANYNGPDSFQFRVTDSGGLLSNTATFSITS